MLKNSVKGHVMYYVDPTLLSSASASNPNFDDQNARIFYFGNTKFVHFENSCILKIRA